VEPLTRVLIIMAFFVGGFWCYALDPVNVSVMLAQRLMGHPVEFGVARDRHAVQAILAVGTVLAALAALLRTRG